MYGPERNKIPSLSEPPALSGIAPDLQGWRVTTGFQLNRVMRSSDMTAIDLGMIPKAVLIHLISIMVVV